SMGPSGFGRTTTTWPRATPLGGRTFASVWNASPGKPARLETLNPRMPSGLARAAKAEGRDDWLESLPATIASLAGRWELEVGEPFQPGGQTAWVAPVTQRGDDRVLKVLWRRPEAEHEADGLRVWGGDGSVLLYESAQ